MPKREYQKLLQEKALAKQELYKKCYPGTEVKAPLVIFFAPDSEVEMGVMFQVLEGVLVLPAKVIVISNKEPEDVLKHPTGKITWVSPEDGRAKEVIENYILAADMAVVFDEHMKEIRGLMNKGVVIVGMEKSPLLKPYHPNKETGYSFTFRNMNPWDVFKALVRAHETYVFPYDWGNIVRAMLKVKL